MFTFGMEHFNGAGMAFSRGFLGEIYGFPECTPGYFPENDDILLETNIQILTFVRG